MAGLIFQMKATLLSSYIAYSGPCVVDEAAGKVTLKVDAAWRPDYLGTEQVRFFKFDNGKLLFGPAWQTQRLTTAEPDEAELEVAIAALQAVIDYEKAQAA